MVGAILRLVLFILIFIIVITTGGFGIKAMHRKLLKNVKKKRKEVLTGQDKKNIIIRKVQCPKCGQKYKEEFIDDFMVNNITRCPRCKKKTKHTDIIMTDE